MVQRNSIESKTIDILRYGMSCFVVMMHVAMILPISKFAGQPFLDSCSSGGWSGGVYSFFYITVAGLITQIAVPLFFTISGYFYFKNIHSISLKVWVNKNKVRLYSLLVPYILWNVIFLISHFVVSVVSHQDLSSFLSSVGGWRFMIDCNNQQITLNIIGVNMRSSAVPLDGPMWFVRDLIMLSLISPIFSFFKGRTEVALLFLALVLMVFNVFIPLPFISSIGFFFFGLGAFLSKRDISLFSVTLYRKWIVRVAFILSFVFAFISYGRNEFLEYASRQIFVLCGVFAIFDLALCLVSRIKLKSCKVDGLPARSFLIYAAHYNFVMALMVKFSTVLIPTDFSLVLWLVSSFLVVLTIDSIYLLLNKFMPRFFLLLTGGR